MPWSYACAGADWKATKLNGFLGSKILESNLINAVANRTFHPTPGLLTQESRFYNKRHIATRMMQSFIFPPEIVHEMDKADHRNYRQLTPSALYTSTKAVLKLMNKFHANNNTGIVLGVWVVILNMNMLPNTNILELSMHKPKILLPLKISQSTLPQELILIGTTIPEVHLYTRMK